MRAVIAVVVVVAGCGSSGADEVEQAPITRLDLPRADESAHVMVLADAKPAALVWVGANGTMAIKPGAKWNGDITVPVRTPPPDDLRRSVLHAIVDGGGKPADEAQSTLDLIDARMGRRVSTRSMSWQARGGPDVPGRGRLQAADAISIDRLSRIAPLVIATPSAPAAAVARLLQQNGGALAVDHLGKLAVLKLAFEPERDRPPPGTGSWHELAIDAKGVHLVTQPEGRDQLIPWAGAMIDRAALSMAYVSAGGGPVDVTVREDTTMQTLVDVLVALRTIDVRQIAIAAAPSADERAEQLKDAREKVILGVPNAQGDLAKPAITAVVRDSVGKLQACYERELVRDPMLMGTVQTMFFITPTGVVATVSSSGVGTALASCVAGVFRAMVFPKPAGGGGVQVNYPLTFRP